LTRLASLAWLLSVAIVAPAAIPATAGQVTLSWVDNSSNELGFRVERKTGEAGTLGQVGVVGANTTSFTDVTVDAGNLYCYFVRAYNAAGDSAPSNEACGLAVTFRDVGSAHWAWRYVESLAAHGVTVGCGATNYCPDGPITRAEMAVFLLKAMFDGGHVPPAPSGDEFRDVPASHWAAGWIEELVAEGITVGCGNDDYCPQSPVTRAQMAVFLLRAKHGGAFLPPTATGGVFSDVPRSHWAAAWIELLAQEGITTGCAPAAYCPESPVTRAQMAVFLVRALGLPLPF
jgi:S-layer homology domain